MRKRRSFNVWLPLFLFFLSLGILSFCFYVRAEQAPPSTAPQVVVVTDYDSTIVDTDKVLVNDVIPAAVQDLLQRANLNEDQRQAWLNFQRFLKRNDPIVPSFQEREWRFSRQWPFPDQALPREIDQMVDPSQSLDSRIQSFWALMRKHFYEARLNKKQPPVIDAFRHFFQRMQELSDGKVKWVILTSRRSLSISSLQESLPFFQGDKTRRLKHDVEIITRERSGTSSEDNARYKVEKLTELSGRFAGTPMFFVDNDDGILEEVNREVRGVRLLIMAPNRGSHPQTRHRLLTYPDGCGAYLE